jgi:hypothetical protein
VWYKSCGENGNSTVRNQWRGIVIKSMATELEELVSFLSSPSPQVNKLTSLLFHFNFPIIRRLLPFQIHFIVVLFPVADNKGCRWYSSRINRLRGRFAFISQSSKSIDPCTVPSLNCTQGKDTPLQLTFTYIRVNWLLIY